MVEDTSNNSINTGLIKSSGGQITTKTPKEDAASTVRSGIMVLGMGTCSGLSLLEQLAFYLLFELSEAAASCSRSLYLIVD